MWPGGRDCARPREGGGGGSTHECASALVWGAGGSVMTVWPGMLWRPQESTAAQRVLVEPMTFFLPGLLLLVSYTASSLYAASLRPLTIAHGSSEIFVWLTPNNARSARAHE